MERALVSLITTEMIDKETSRLVRGTFHEVMSRDHEEKLVAERKAREQAEQEIAKLKEEN